MNSIFWISVIFFISNFSNFVKLLFFSELTWIILYCFILIKGSINDDITLLSTSIFVLGFAGIEYSLGIIIIMLFKQINKKIDFNDVENTVKNQGVNQKNSSYINRYLWEKLKK